MENKEIYVSTAGLKPHHMNDHVCSVCTSIVTEIKLALQCSDVWYAGYNIVFTQSYCTDS